MNNEVGKYSYVDYNYLVAGAKMKLNIRDSVVDDLYLKDLANLATKRLRNLGTMVNIVVQLPIDLINHRVKLPEGFIRFNKYNPIAYVDAQGTVVAGTDTQSVVYSSNPILPNFFGNPTNTNAAFFENNPYPQNGWLGGTVNEQNGYLFFSTNVTAEFVKIAYLSANMDSDGQLLIPAVCEDALVAFMCWNYCRTNMDIPKYAAAMSSYELEWKKGKPHAKAIFNMTSALDYQSINYKMLSLI